MLFIYFGLFLISAATLLLEVTLTRVLAIAQWHHFAFWIISMAMLGFGVSGTLLSIFPSFLKRCPERFLPVTSTIFSLSSVGSFALINRIPLDQFVILWDFRQLLYLALTYLALSFPFIASGLCVGFLLSKKTGEVGRLYFFTMAGSGVGCALAIWIASFGAPKMIVFASVLGAVAALLFSLRSSKIVVVSMLLLVTVSVVAFMYPFPLKINVTPYKDLPTLLRFPQTKILSTHWNSFSKIDVIEGPSIRYAPGLSFQFQDTLPKQLGITWDEDGLTVLTEYGENVSCLEFTDFFTSSLVYHFKSNPKVLVLGIGGGLDVLSAMYHEAQSVTGIEMNPILTLLLKDTYRHISGEVFQQPKVKLIVDEGRSFLRRNRETFDVIQISLLDSQTSASAGAYGLSENYIYTVEAFKEYYEHLTRDGILSITRWLMLPPRDCLRLCAIALTALEEIGIERPEEHIALIRSWGTSTFLLKRSSVSAGDAAIIKQFCREKNFDVIFFPGVREEEVNVYNQLSEAYYYRYVDTLMKTSDRSAFFSDYLLDVRPTTDDRPFFYHFLEWRNVKRLYRTVGERLESFILWGDIILMAVLGQALLISLILVLLPLWIMGKKRWQDTKKHASLKMLLYFLCLGFGFMFVEIVLIQKFILFLGRPVYSISVVLSSVLIFSGCGSLASKRFGARPMIVLPGLSLVVILYHFSLPPLFDLILGHALTVRILVSVALLGPLGFVLGIPFPLGIRLLNRIWPASIPWAWGVNSCASVVGSISAVAIALHFGFSVVFLSASVLYLICIGLVFKEMRRNSDSLSNL